MASTSNLSEIIRRISFLQAGGGKKSTLEGINEIFGSVGKIADEEQDRRTQKSKIASEVLQRKRNQIALENEKRKQEYGMTEVRDVFKPITIGPVREAAQPARDKLITEREKLGDRTIEEQERIQGLDIPGTGTQTDTISALQLGALQRGDPKEIARVFPGGRIPIRFVNTAVASGRNVVQTDELGNKFLLNKATNTRSPIDPGQQQQGIRKLVQLAPEEKDFIVKERDKFIAGKVGQEIEARARTSGELGRLIQANPKNAFGQIATQLAKFAGEVGRLTDPDIERNIVPKQLVAKVRQLVSLAVRGKFDKMRLEELALIFDLVEKANIETFNRKLKNTVDSSALLIPNVDKGQLREFIGGRSILFDFKPIGSIDIGGLTQQEIEDEIAALEAKDKATGGGQ